MVGRLAAVLLVRGLALAACPRFLRRGPSAGTGSECQSPMLIFSAVRLNLLQDRRRNLLDRFRRRRQPPDPLPLHHRFRFVYLIPAILDRRILAAGAAFVADFGEALGGDREAENLVAEWGQGRGQLAPFEV